MIGLLSRLVLGLLWCLHFLPLRTQASIANGLGSLLWRLAKSRRKVALRNLELCFPEKSEQERFALAKQHFKWVARSVIDRGMLWYASADRLGRHLKVEGEVHFAERTDRPVMWLVPHFVGLEFAGTATQLCQQRPVASIYQVQSNPVFDETMRRGRLRFGRAEIFPRSDKVLPLVRAIKQGKVFFNLPDMDFGMRDAAFVPFFGVPAATLLAPSRMARSLGMVVQPIVTEILPRGEGWCVRFLQPWTDFPSDDAEADTARMNSFIEDEIRKNPAQYLWVHKRFKTRPPEEPSLY